MGQHTPLTPRFILVKEGIQDTAQTDRAWGTKMFSFINIWLQDVPFRITYISWIMRIMSAFLFHDCSFL